MSNPHIGSCSLTKISLCIHIDSSIFTQSFNLIKSCLIFLRVHSKSSSSKSIYYRKSRDITRSISNINHIMKFNSAGFFRHFCINIYIWILRNALINFKKSPRFCCIINRIADF